MIQLRLKAGREKSVTRRHPWIFASAVAGLDGTPDDGDTVEVCSSSGEFLAWGAVSLKSQIRLRLWSWDPSDEIGDGFFHSQIQKALAFRSSLPSSGNSNASRLV